MENPVTDFDLIVIGAGPGGYHAAIKAAHNGLKTAVVEKEHVGGVCLNKGCIPTKTLLHSAKIFSEMKHAEEMGILFDESSLNYDMPKFQQRKNTVVEKLRSGVAQLLKSNKVMLIEGAAKISSPNTVIVNENETFTAKNIIIATGSKPFIPPFEGHDVEGLMTSDELLSCDKKLDDLIIIGGGVIGVEFADLYSNLGTKVTIIEMADRILPLMDKEISQNLSMILKKKGVDVQTATALKKISKNDTYTCTIENKKGVSEINASNILIATGRKVFLDGLFGNGVEIETNRFGIVVNEKLQTSIPSIYAIGDVNGSIQLAHVAMAQGGAVISNILGKNPEINLNLIPSCVYTEPEIACVGLTLDEAKAQGINAKAGKFGMASNGKMIIENVDRGFVKFVVNEDTKEVIGAQLMCGRASDMIFGLAIAIQNKLTVDDLLKTVFPHPTFSEGIYEGFENIFGVSTHTTKL